MDKQKQTVPKIRKDKKKNTETGILMGQNTNIFSQLSATYLQSKSSATQQETNFANSTQIVQYHDQNINRLIALLRKKADVTKAKAALELKQQMMKMNQENIQEFIQTFSHLFMQVVINEQSKQVIDQFVNMMNHVLANFKKIAIKEIATIFGPFFVINRSNNISQVKTYGMLFSGTEEQLHEKAITLLLSKNVMKKFLVFCRVIIECEQAHKIGQQNFQRNCSSLLKVIKDFIKSYELIPGKKQETQQNFGKFVSQINEIVSGKFVDQYFKIGGKAKSSFLQFYQTLISSSTKHHEWDIDWQTYAKIICQNYLDKDLVVQQSLWKFCNKQFIESSLELQKIQKEEQKQMKEVKQKDNKQKERYWIFHKYLPKPDQKLLSALKLGCQTLYKQLPSYCTVFPYTSFEQKQSHKSAVNKIGFIRKLMQTILELEDQNEARVQSYYQLAVYFIKILRNVSTSISQLDQKKQQQIKTLAAKAQKEIVNTLQDKFYKNPPTSRNSFTYNVPTFFCKLLQDCEPNFDFIFDQKQTFPLYCNLKNNKNSQYITNLYNRIYDNCKNDQNLLLQYLENFPTKEVPLDMTQANKQIQQSSKIFLLSQQSKKPQNWFNQNWDPLKKLITFDPRITSSDLASVQQYQSSHQYYFKPTNKSISDERYASPLHDEQRFQYFIKCLQDNQLINMIPFMLPIMKQIIMQRNNENKVKYINKLLQIHNKGVQKLTKKQWIVSQLQVLRVRALADLILEGLKSLDQSSKGKEQQKYNVNEQLLDSFLKNYCLFVLTIYNYKLENQAQELLKLVFKALYIEKISEKIFTSAEQSIKQAYQAFAKVGANQIKQMKQGQQKQRKNRLNRLLNYIKKVVWYAVNKKKHQYYTILFEDLLSSNDWKHAQYRPDLWLIAQCYLEIMDEKIKKNIIDKFVKEHQKYSHFLTLLMCCQMILPLQRHPSTKKIIQQLQISTIKQIKQHFNDQQCLNLISSMINQYIGGQSFLLIYGIKNLLKSVMKTYQKLPSQILEKYVAECIEKPLSALKQSSDQTGFLRKSLLLLNLLTDLPLLDLPKVENIYNQISKLTETEKNSIKILGYSAILATIWQSSIGIDKISNQNATQITERVLTSLKQALNENNVEKNNFARLCGLTFFNQFIQIKSKEPLKDSWDYILSQIVWTPVQQGSLLHGNLQSARFKFISKIFSSSPKQLQAQIVKTIPQQIVKEVNFYKQVLDQIEDEEQQQKTSSNQNHYQNIVNMFIEFAEVMVRIATGLNKQIKPKQQTVLQLLQCPFAGIKKTAFMLLKQMYELNLVEKAPPAIFLTYLKISPENTKGQLNPIVANILSSYLYSWQAIIQRRSAIQRPASGPEEQNILTLQDYLQNEQLHQSFLKSIFQILQNQLQFAKNQQDFQISPEELIQMDSAVNIEDDLNMLNKVFRLVIRTLFKFIQNFPLFLRNFMDKNKKYKNTCDRLLRNVISDAIFKEEITKIEMTEHEWKSAGNFQIYVTPKNKQIYAEYTHDVIRIGLRLSMKGNYPLTPISIEFGQGLKIDEGSRWALMLQNQLHSRNNTIINGILLWKDNIDKKLAGVEQCAICYDIVNSSGQLPKKGCKTCKKKFHSVCVMKWFSKSNKSECPLCKSQFL